MEIDRPITIAITVLVIIFLAFFLLVPEYNMFRQLQADLGIKKAEFNAEFDYYAAIAQTYFTLQTRQDDLKKIDDALPQDSSLGKLVYFLQGAAVENGMLVKDLFLSKSSIGISQSGTSDAIKDISFTMDVLGDYTSLGGFISSLEKSSRIFEVTNISFGSPTGPALESAQSQFQIQQTYSFSLQIKTHSY